MRRSIANHVVMVVCVVALGVLLLALQSRAQGANGKSRLQVVTTLFPLYDWAKVIGGEQAEVLLLLPPGVESHSFEPTPRDISTINKADLFIYTGALMEPWVEDILKGRTGGKLVVVDTSRGIHLLDAEDEHGEHDHHEGHESGDHGKSSHEHEAHVHSNGEAGPHEGKDPHIWLEFGNAQKMVDTIASAFAEKDPAHAEVYLHRSVEYKNSLKALDGEYSKALSACRQHTLIYGGHFAFGYMAKRYGLETVSPYGGFSPDAEPSPRRIAELIGTMKKLESKYVYYEEGIEPRVAKIISEETGAGLLLLHGAHNVSKDEMGRGVSYLAIMEENLKRLKLGLECP